MTGFKSCLDDLSEIRKRREELFPKAGLQPEEPFVQPMTATEVLAGQVDDNWSAYGRSPALLALPTLRWWNVLPPADRARMSAQWVRDREAFLDLYR